MAGKRLKTPEDVARMGVLTLTSVSMISTIVQTRWYAQIQLVASSARVQLVIASNMEDVSIDEFENTHTLSNPLIFNLAIISLTYILSTQNFLGKCLLTPSDESNSVAWST